MRLSLPRGCGSGPHRVLPAPKRAKQTLTAHAHVPRRVPPVGNTLRRMRLLLTIEAGPDRSDAPRGSGSGSVTQHDIALSYAPETRVRDLAAALTGSAEAVPANVVALPGSAGVPTLTGPLDLYLGDELLEPEQRIDESPVRHGVVAGSGSSVLPARAGTPWPGGGPHLLRTRRGPRAPPRDRPGHPGPRPALHDPDPRAGRRAGAGGRRGGARPRGVARRRRDDHPRPRGRGPRDVRAAAPRTGDRADRARGEHDERDDQAAQAFPPQAQGHGVPAR